MDAPAELSKHLDAGVQAPSSTANAISFVYFPTFVLSGIGSKNPRNYADKCIIAHVAHNALMTIFKIILLLTRSGVKKRGWFRPKNTLGMERRRVLIQEGGRLTQSRR